MNIKFRENWTTHKVEVFVDDKFHSSYSEYKFAAEQTQRRFGLDNSQMMQIYRDYKDDFDS